MQLSAFATATEKCPSRAVWVSSSSGWLWCCRPASNLMGLSAF